MFALSTLHSGSSAKQLFGCDVCGVCAYLQLIGSQSSWYVLTMYSKTNNLGKTSLGIEHVYGYLPFIICYIYIQYQNIMIQWKIHQC